MAQDQSHIVHTADPEIDLSSIINNAQHYLLNDHAMKEEIMAKLRAEFLIGVEKYHGPEARAGVERDGLKMVHKHFPVEKVRLLEFHLRETLRDDLYYWSYKVGAETLGIPNEFFVDHLIVIRIHYPHLVARKARAEDIAAPPYAYTERMRLLQAALRNPKMLAYAGSRAIAKKLDERRKKKSHAYDAKAYHGNLATPARAHGAHVDTWYGHSYDGINLWLSIDGVNEGNTVILYPGMWGQEVHFDPVSMYLKEGQATPRPLKYAMEPGQLLVLNPEMLHGTQVNISDETRVALTTRLNPHEPRFAKEAPFHFEYWYSSKDLADKRWGKMSAFPHKEFQGDPSWTSREPYKHKDTEKLTLNFALEKDADPVDICSVDDLKPGHRLGVDFTNAKVMIWRTKDGLRAYHRSCPHMGIDTIDGFQDGKEVFCPGHGMSFSVETGESSCEAFKLKAVKATEKDGRVFLARTAAA
ncbi:Rieske 2Fe-2S domain-containing protein [Pseudohalocynthiibacter sp. F2068]|jgi:nitrite reductase/ring-hydroxylating ferredoxin subunit|uniref:Rieske 2Fe-2S domain-containing protein n=1 Tax=Pseudohalocynthiibacter sp. F2068 TaxID=2926418 RepID=UPI001FF3F0A4|nr:Rieske 2Fe-2S domain-containing protein [Pseudohalocynthiibacter sp. F2068]MCK0104310.1 Rieske 2Fe-2S domain-containing protein [Pseudohalocynthiibacter sp. F2068]